VAGEDYATPPISFWWNGEATTLAASAGRPFRPHLFGHMDHKAYGARVGLLHLTRSCCLADLQSRDCLCPSSLRCPLEVVAIVMCVVGMVVMVAPGIQESPTKSALHRSRIRA